MEAQLNMIDFITNFARGFINVQMKEQEKNFNERFLEQERKINKLLEQEKNFNERFLEQERKYEIKLLEQERIFNQRFLEQERKYEIKLSKQERKYEIKLLEQERIFNERFLEQERKINKIFSQEKRNCHDITLEQERKYERKLERISNVAMNAEVTIPPFAGEQQYTTSLNTKNIHLPLYLLKEHLHKFYQITTLHLNLRGGCQPYDKPWNIFQLELEQLPQNLTITEIIIAEAGTGSCLLGGSGTLFPENPLGALEWMFIKFPNVISLNISPSVLMLSNIQNLTQLLNKSKRNIKLRQLEIPTLNQYIMRVNPGHYCEEKDELIKCCKKLMINLII